MGLLWPGTGAAARTKPRGAQQGASATGRYRPLPPEVLLLADLGPWNLRRLRWLWHPPLRHPETRASLHRCFGRATMLPHRAWSTRTSRGGRGRRSVP